VRAPTSEPAALREALSRAHGVIGCVRKTRWLLRVAQTRVHLDRVHGLGDFMELEVVLQGDQSAADGEAIAEALMVGLGVIASQRLAGAYLDLLLTASSAAGIASDRNS
jgi:adenylate cyclase class IV